MRDNFITKFLFRYCRAQTDFFKTNILITVQSRPFIFEPRHEIYNNVVCATSKTSDQPAHTRSLIRVFASRLTIL